MLTHRNLVALLQCWDPEFRFYGGATRLVHYFSAPRFSIYRTLYALQRSCATGTSILP